jgi:hypothetical protein
MGKSSRAGERAYNLFEVPLIRLDAAAAIKAPIGRLRSVPGGLVLVHGIGTKCRPLLLIANSLAILSTAWT